MVFHRLCLESSCKVFINTYIENPPWLGEEFMVNFQKPICNTQRDIVFDLYREDSMKSDECHRRSKVKGIATDIWWLD